MTGRRWTNGFHCPPGYQRHHLIPRAVALQPQLASFLGKLEQDGACLSNFAANGLSLPGDERLAASTGLALHRGPHPAYNDVVMARMDQIRVTSVLVCGSDRWAAAARIATLQSALRRALTDHHRHRFWLNRRDPMRIFADRDYLDSAIAALFGNEQ